MVSIDKKYFISYYYIQKIKDGGGTLNNIRPLWEVFPDLVEMVRRDQVQRGAARRGHDFLHALMVAQYGPIIAEDERVGILSWVGGICHNTNRIFPEPEIQWRLETYLGAVTNLSGGEKELVLEAVIEHSKLNNPDDNPVTITLKDADRLANIGPNLFIRSGQFYHNLPAYDPHYVINPDPTATYHDPKTVLHDIRCSLEWEPWLRLPKAKKLAKPYFEQLRIFIKGFETQLKEVNLLPYPF